MVLLAGHKQYTINSTLCENQIATHLKQFGQPEPFPSPPQDKPTVNYTHLSQNFNMISDSVIYPALAHGQYLPIGGLGGMLPQKFRL